MKRRYLYSATALIALTALSAAHAKNAQQEQMQMQQEQMRNAQAQAGRAQAEGARQQQQQEMKAQQEQMRQVQEQQLKAQELARSNQEQAVRGQEEQARKSQMQAIKMQQDQARKMQEQAQKQMAGENNSRLQQAQRAQQEQAEQIQKAQQEQIKEAQKSQQEQAQQIQKAQQEQAKLAEKSQQEQAREIAKAQQEAGFAQRSPQEQAQLAQKAQEYAARRAQEMNAKQNVAAVMNPNRTAFMRAPTPRPLNATVIPTEKAVSMPVLEAGVTEQEREHANIATHNLQTHLIAVEASQAPVNISATRNLVTNNYFNNYHTLINNHAIMINRQNTMINPVPPMEYPHWYQQEPGWTYSNGFTLGSVLNVGVDWLRWGWHPYFGPPPDGFVCASDYIPTPWIYVPAYGLWREPGVMGYADAGPPFDYEGPITVEVLEPRHIHVRDPFTGWMTDRTINVVYLYNAYYYPEFERYGYMNRHGYFIWLNLDGSDSSSF